jgi:hypothetical protein
VRHNQPPPYRALSNRVLVVILWRKRPPIYRGNFLAATLATVDAGIGSGSAGAVNDIECLMVRDLKKISILIESHGKSVPPLSRRDRLARCAPIPLKLAPYVDTESAERPWLQRMHVFRPLLDRRRRESPQSPSCSRMPAIFAPGISPSVWFAPDTGRPMLGGRVSVELTTTGLTVRRSTN